MGCGRREYRLDVYQQLWGQIRELDLWVAAPPKRDTPPEASRNPSIAVTNRVPNREHAMDLIKKPSDLHRFFWSGSSVF